MAIERPQHLPPILRPEISIEVEELSDREAKKQKMLQLLEDLNPAASRAVVFVTSRRRAEELAILINQQTRLSAEPFHAGLSAETRRETYERFQDKNSPMSVLCATKAFGMGMDIDNIHLVIHFGPPSSLEDYIQEIGRAARKPETLVEAGRETAAAWLLYEKGDFQWLRSRLNNDFLSYRDLQNLHQFLIKEATATPARKFAIEPKRVAYQLWAGQGAENKVRVGLFWLEQLKRVEVGFYAALDVTVEIDGQKAALNRRALGDGLEPLLDYLLQRAISTPSGPVTAASQQAVNPTPAGAGSATELTVSFQVQEAVTQLHLNGPGQLFEQLTELARLSIIRFQRQLLLPLKQERAQEARVGCATNRPWPKLGAAMIAVKDLGQGLNREKALERTEQDLQEIFQKIAGEELEPDAGYWLPPEKRQDWSQKEQKSFTKSLPAVLKLLRGLRVVRIKEEVRPTGVLFRLQPWRREWQSWFKALPDLVPELLRCVVQAQTSADNQAEPEPLDSLPGEVEPEKLLLAASAMAQKYGIKIKAGHVEAILRFLHRVGYLEYADRLVPFGIEIKVVKTAPLQLENPSPPDSAIFQKFDEQQWLRILRLAALQAVPHLAGEPESLRQFVEEHYFQVESAQALLDLLEKTLPAGSEILSQLREEALVELVDGNLGKGKPGLSDEQKAVYNAPLDQHLLIIAGPGAGKTHTLLARLVGLVHKHKIQPNRILVLAFTRAVVSELKHRLQDLLGRLGYGATARQFKVTTFHSFVLSQLSTFNLVPQNYSFDDGKDLFKEFERYVNQNPELRRQLASSFDYVFIDEFQDVHGPRYDLIRHLTGSGRTYLVVVGDDDQSIYDYERSGVGEDTVQSFNNFKAQFRPVEYYLTWNYRSTAQILEASQSVVQELPGRLKVGRKIISHRSQRGQFNGLAADWKPADLSDLSQLVQEVQQTLCSTASQRRRPEDNTIAILARTNRDVYRVKTELQQTLGQNFRLLVQGSESKFIDRRDVAELLDFIRREYKADGQLTKKSLEELLRTGFSQPEFQLWVRDASVEQHELWYLAQEFLAEMDGQAKLADYLDFIHEMSDNGNYLRVVARRAAGNGQGRILLSTIHKVKGIEFPAVILLNSEMKVDHPDQELRVMYVGMTRAEDVLVILRGEREERLLQRQPYATPAEMNGEILVEPSLKDVFMSRFGYDWLKQLIIEKQIRPGDSITIVRNNGAKNPFWIKHDRTGQQVGLLAGVSEKNSLTCTLLRQYPMVRQFTGLEVVNVYRRYTEQDKRTDEQNSRQTNFYGNLCDEVKDQGYYYMIEIGGLLAPG